MHTVVIILFILFCCPVAYLLLFAIASLKRVRSNKKDSISEYNFAVIFPAYKEDNVIIDSVTSFFNQNINQNFYKVFVIADHMQDNTIEELKKLGANVIVATYQNSTKMKALQLAVQYFETESMTFDIVVILDADNIVDIDFLNKIGLSFASGSKAIQTHRMAKTLDSSVAIMDAASEEINNSIFRKGHIALGLSSALIGSGMAFDFDWFCNNIKTAESESVGEDKLLELMLLEQRIHIHYLNDVKTYDAKVSKQNDFYLQRRRWIATQFNSLTKCCPYLCKSMKTHNINLLDKWIQWMMPSNLILAGVIFIISIIATIIDASFSIKWWILTAIMASVLLISLPSYLYNKKTLKALINLPVLFIMMIIDLFQFKSPKGFLHTKH